MRLHTTLLLPDVHAPWHNKILFRKILQLALDIRPQCAVTTGDFLDCYSISRHNEGSLEKLRNITLDYEYQVGLQLITDLNSACKSAKEKHYIYGNHEDNFNRYKEKGDNGKTGKALLRPEQALRLEETGWKVYKKWMEDSVPLGNHLEAMHGTSTAKHAAAQTLDEVEGSVVFGHTHRFQIFLTGKRGSYNIGFLGDKDSEGFHYVSKNHRRKWVNAFAVNYTLNDGSFRMCPIQCWNNRFVFNGKLY